MKYTSFLAASAALVLGGCQAFQGLQRDFQSMGSAIGSGFEGEEEAQAESAVQVARNSGCPPIIVDPQMSSATEFYDMEKTTAGTEISSIKLSGTQSSCEIEGEFVNVQIDLSFTGQLGPKAKRKSADRPYFSYPYFIAVTDDKGNELAREIFAASVTYEKDAEIIDLVETIRQKLPLENDGSMPGYQIHIGFQLTQEQLFYNASL